MVEVTAERALSQSKRGLVHARRPTLADTFGREPPEDLPTYVLDRAVPLQIDLLLKTGNEPLVGVAVENNLVVDRQSNLARKLFSFIFILVGDTFE